MSSRSKGAHTQTNYDARIIEGKRLTLSILRSTVRAGGHLVLDLALALAFDGFPYPMHDVRRIPGQRWQFVWRDRRDLEPIAAHVPPNHATVALAVRGHSTVYGISPERLLSRSETTSPPSAARAYLLELYRADATSVMETEARRNRDLRHLVESEAYAELGRSSPWCWRSTEEILYEVGLGARLDELLANPAGQPYEDVEASVEGELDALVDLHADAMDAPAPPPDRSERTGLFGRAARSRAPRSRGLVRLGRA